MDLVGLKVIHASHGEGEVVKVEEEKKRIFVEYDSDTVRHEYPNAFVSHLKLREEDAEVLLFLSDEIAKHNVQVAEQQRLEVIRLEEEAAKKLEKAMKDPKQRFYVDYGKKWLREDKCLTYQQVQRDFGFQIQYKGSGMNKTTKPGAIVPYGSIVLISCINQQGGMVDYHDKWLNPDEYLYEGAARTNKFTGKKEWSLSGLNWDLKYAERYGDKVYLFVKFSSTSYYYQGEFKVIDVLEPIEDGVKKIKFRLRRVSGT